ncbi:sodium-bile acid cotransporter [Striga asiatica]|uniref:Sodium-bile acid cotransporter n=1 Tax=Striga asiatica TaxID=4170 RepID=A0A5A7R936_STRAF|nr:sodium-bile acid cotransporter [Striga asiatica]
MMNVHAIKANFSAPFTRLHKSPTPTAAQSPPAKPFPAARIKSPQIQLHFRQPFLVSPAASRFGAVPRPKPLLCSNSSSALTAEKKSWIEAVGEAISTAFPVWVALGCLLGLLRPGWYDWVQPKWTVMGITVTMLGMGMTLTFDDLRGALAMPKELLAGFFLQYSKKLRLQIMPLSGFFVSKLLNLPTYYAAGLILVGCCPGGTASNIVTYIARGNVALSVLMTAASTLTAVVITPYLTAKLAGQYVAVDAIGLFIELLFIFPFLAVTLLHTSGFFFGYVFSRFLGIDVSSSRTISIEVGMQNSVLGVVLATQHFGDPLTAVPCAVSSVCHSIFGSTLAGIWRRTVPVKNDNFNLKQHTKTEEQDT